MKSQAVALHLSRPRLCSELLSLLTAVQRDFIWAQGRMDELVDSEHPSAFSIHTEAVLSPPVRSPLMSQRTVEVQPLHMSSIRVKGYHDSRQLHVQLWHSPRPRPSPSAAAACHCMRWHIALIIICPPAGLCKLKQGTMNEELVILNMVTLTPTKAILYLMYPL